jgi:SpoVK/Ycf46/Vps4 family AAA+-type ATPase
VDVRVLPSQTRGVPHDLTGDQLAQLASHTAGLSGADIEELVTEAKRQAARRGARTVSIEDFPTPEELDAMIEDIRLGPTSGVNPSNEDESFSENVFDDDSTVGFQ